MTVSVNFTEPLELRLKLLNSQMSPLRKQRAYCQTCGEFYEDKKGRTELTENGELVHGKGHVVEMVDVW